MENIIVRLNDILATSYSLGIAFAFVAGIITLLAPCSISNTTLMVTYVNSISNSKKKAIVYTLTVCLGQILLFVTLGIIAASLGKLFNLSGLGKFWHITLALFMFIMALELWNITHIIPHCCTSRLKVTRKGILGSFMMGILGSLICLPCAVPFLSVILVYVSSYGSLTSSVILLLSYSIGHCLLIITAGSSLDYFKKLSSKIRSDKVYKVIRFVFGFVVLALGIYLVLDVFVLAHH